MRKVSEAATRKSRGSGDSEFDRFSGFMKRLVAVPHSEIKAKLDAEKKAKARKSVKTSASRASHDGD
jgi:hypothetical protein